MAGLVMTKQRRMQQRSPRYHFRSPRVLCALLLMYVCAGCSRSARVSENNGTTGARTTADCGDSELAAPATRYRILHDTGHGRHTCFGELILDPSGGRFVYRISAVAGWGSPPLDDIGSYAAGFDGNVYWVAHLRAPRKPSMEGTAARITLYKSASAIERAEQKSMGPFDNSFDMFAPLHGLLRRIGSPRLDAEAVVAAVRASSHIRPVEAGSDEFARWHARRTTTPAPRSDERLFVYEPGCVKRSFGSEDQSGGPWRFACWVDGATPPFIEVKVESTTTEIIGKFSMPLPAEFSIVRDDRAREHVDFSYRKYAGAHTKLLEDD
jgi:hypothetical protein